MALSLSNKLRKITEGNISMFKYAVYEYRFNIMVGTDYSIDKSYVFINIGYILIVFHAYDSYVCASS